MQNRLHVAISNALFGRASREQVLAGLDLRNLTGLEFGPLSRPLVRKTDGNIFYVDYRDGNELREAYRDDPAVDTDAIIAPDIIWNCGCGALADAAGRTEFDYVIAAHVIEHVPDLICWLDEVRSVLKPNGSLRLVVPDRRYSFDLLRRETNLTDLVNAYLRKAHAPLAHMVFDFHLLASAVNASEVWRGRVDPKKLSRNHTPQIAIKAAERALAGEYIDVHCWVFTPHSFALLFGEAAKLNLIHYRCERLTQTRRGQLDFLAVLIPSDNIDEIVDSWDRAGRSLRR